MPPDEHDEPVTRETLIPPHTWVEIAPGVEVFHTESVPMPLERGRFYVRLWLNRRGES